MPPENDAVLCDLCGKPIEDWRIVPAQGSQPEREEGWSPCHPQGPVITRPRVVATPLTFKFVKEE